MFDRWAAGESGIADGLARCDEFEASEHLSRREARRSARFTQIALVSALEALADAGWGGEDPPVDPARIGCVIGTGIGGLPTIEEQHDKLNQRGPAAISPLCIPTMMANAASGAIAIRHGFKGQCYGTVSACAAGAQAVGAGMRMVQSGDADVCVVGGTESAITPLGIAAFAGMGATSKLGISRPFDRLRDGFIMGEGGAVMVLEAADVANARGAEIRGRASGYGATADAFHLTAPDPEGDGSARAIRLALDEAGVRPDQLDYVNAHGTSTELNDRSETVALKLALGESAANVPISSLKSSIGHLLGAAGAVEAVATVLALEAGIAPPTLNLTDPDDGLDLDYVPGSKRKLAGDGRPLTGVSNSFGFGGHNAVLCFRGPE
jgi:3-oxoacyl-[acyl-carrier-protein] synthase II